MFVLRKDLRIRKRTQAQAHLAEDGPCHLAAGNPEIRSEDLSSTFDHRVRQAHLAVQFERARLDGQRARRRPRLRRPVDDPHSHAQPRQPQRQHEARRAGPNNENVSLACRRHIPLDSMTPATCTLHVRPAPAAHERSDRPETEPYQSRRSEVSHTRRSAFRRRDRLSTSLRNRGDACSYQRHW